MSPRSSLAYGLGLALLLTSSVTQALPPHQASIHVIAKSAESPHNGSVVPGESPVKYRNDPSDDLFKIESLDMFPNPCVIESYCSVVIHGEFTTSLRNTTPHVSFNVTSHLPNNRTGLLPGEDAFCNWVSITQQADADDENNHMSPASQRLLAPELHQFSFLDYLPAALDIVLRKQRTRKEKVICPPKKGKAKITSTILLLGGYVPEANFTVKVKATAEGKGGKEGKTIFDLGTDFELKYKDGYISK